MSVFNDISIWPRTNSRLGLFVTGSILLHLGLFFVLTWQSPVSTPLKDAKKPIKVALLKPDIKKEPEQIQAQQPIDLTRRVEIKKKIEPKKQDPIKKPLNEKPRVERVDPNVTPPPAIAGLTEKSFSEQGVGVASAGNTTMAVPTDKAVAPAQVKPLVGNGSTTGNATPLNITQISKMPQVMGDCPPGNTRDYYSQEAIDQNIEGKVVLEIVISEQGLVKTAKIIKGLGYGLDQAAQKAMLQKCRFSPAELNGQKVPSTIKYTFNFVLDE